MTNIAHEVREALASIDFKAAMRVAFGKCPKCNRPMAQYRWIQGCEDRACQGYVGPRNAPLPDHGLDLEDPAVVEQVVRAMEDA